MNNEKRNWRNSNDRRDGKTFEKKEMKNILKHDRPYKKREDRGGYEHKKYGDTQGSYRSRGGYGYGNRDNNNQPHTSNSRDRKGYDSSRNDNGYGSRRNDNGYDSRRNDNGYGSRRNDSGYNERFQKREKLDFRKKTSGDYTDERKTNFVETRFDINQPKVAFRKRRSSPDYDPNAKYSHKKQMAYKQSFVDPTKPIRLNKYIANAGVCSRREADGFIQAGVISVNGVIVSELGTKVLPTDRVMFHNEPVSLERKIYILLNKPKDTVTTVEDTHNRKTVMDIVKNACSERVYPVGRLDRNTTGVLLITNDGELTTKLTHPKNNMKKIYHVGLNRALEKADFNQLLEGVDLGDCRIKVDALEYVKEDSEQEVGIEIHSGQNRVVRRLFDQLGYKVMKLDRVYFAGLTKKNVPRGKYRFLSQKEINMLQMGAFG